MRYMVRTSIVEVIGSIWMPSTTAAYTYTLTGHDIFSAQDENGQVTRESVQSWLDCHAGDFAGIDDFHASLEVGGETVEFPWLSENSEITFNGCVWGDEE